MDKLPEDYSLYILSKKELATYLLLSGNALFLTGILFFKSVPAALLLTLAAWPLKAHYEDYLVERRQRQLDKEFRDLLYALSASISSGRPMPEALKEGRESLALVYGADSFLYQELMQMVQSMEESRVSEARLLQDLARRTSHPDVGQLANVYQICKKTGGDLEKAISKTASILLDRMAMRSQVETLTAQKRLEACILTAIPFLLVLLLNLLSPAYLQHLYETMPGRFLMAAALMAVYGAWRWSLKLTSIKL